MTATSPRARLLFALSFLLLALNMRPVFSSLAAILPDAMRDTGATSFIAGMLTTIPVICLGLFSPVAPPLAARFGTERVLLLAIVLTAGGTALRGFGTVPALLAGGAVAGGAIAIGNVLLPTLLKRDFADRPALMTGCFSMAMCGGAAIGAGLTVPLAHLSGSWADALGLWALLACLATLLWLPFGLRCGREEARAGAGPAAASVWRDRLAWQVTAFFGLQSALAYCVFGWMAPMLRSRGISAEEAGLLTSVSIMAQVVSSLSVPFIGTRGRDQRAICCTLLILAVVGLFGVLFVPRGFVPLAILIQGAGQGGLFAAATLLIILRSPDPRVSGQLSSMAQTVGYLIAAVGPFLVGIIRDASGSYGPTAILFVALGGGALWAALAAGQNRLVGPPEAPEAHPAGSEGVPVQAAQLPS